jgi:hypothetical protein
VSEIARRLASEATGDAVPWELDLIVNTKYVVEHSLSQLEVTLDPRRGNVFRFPIPA